MNTVWIIVAVLLLAFIVLLLLCKYYNDALQCEYYTIEDEQLPQRFRGTKIVMLADLHEHEFGEKNEKLLEKIRTQSPDYIMIAGDLLVKGDELHAERVLPFLEELAFICPVYYAPGNHEEYLERICGEDVYEKYLMDLEKIGVIYLANQSAFLTKGEDRIRVTGLHLQKKYFAKFYESVTLEVEHLEELIGKRQETYELLIAHNPNYLPVYAKWGANLVLSGHVHGGVVVLPWVGGVISTTFQLFPQYDFGLFEEKHTKMVLSRGLGVHTIRLRLFNRPEISVISLK